MKLIFCSLGDTKINFLVVYLVYRLLKYRSSFIKMVFIGKTFIFQSWFSIQAQC